MFFFSGVSCLSWIIPAKFNMEPENDGFQKEISF